MLFFEFGWETGSIRLAPRRLETNTSPVLWEIEVEEQGAKLVFPVVVVHEESAIILAGAELLIGRQGSDVVEDVFIVHFSLLALIRPGELPL